MKYTPRRPLDDDKPDGYLESDRDYLANNTELAVRLLDAYGENTTNEHHVTLRARVKITQAMRDEMLTASFIDADQPEFQVGRVLYGLEGFVTVYNNNDHDKLILDDLPDFDAIDWDWETFRFESPIEPYMARIEMVK
jgi:hypothetical protein